MTTLSVCVEMIFGKLPFPERLDAVAAAGVPAFEFWSWQQKDLAAIQEKKEALGLECAAFAANGGTLLDPANHQAYLDTFGQAAQWARKLRCPSLIVLSGNTLPDVPQESQLEQLQRGLERVGAAAAAAGVVAVLEPLNSKVNHKGYFLDHGPAAFQLVEQIGNPHLRVLYDIYHMQIMDGDIIATIEANLQMIGHFHVADVPGRHDPGTGELNYGNIFRRIDAAGYQGYVGLEYLPQGDHQQSLASVKRLAA